MRRSPSSSPTRGCRPRASARVLRDCPKLAALADRVKDLPKLKPYLASERRLPFNEQGIFRHYPELDG